MQFVLTHMWQMFHIWQNQIQRDSNTKSRIVLNYIITGLTHQVIVLHIHHLTFLYTYYKLALKTCMWLNYVHNAHCNFLKIQTVSIQENAISKVQSSQQYSAWRALRVFWMLFSIQQARHLHNHFKGRFSIPPHQTQFQLKKVMMSKTHQKEWSLLIISGLTINPCFIVYMRKIIQRTSWLTARSCAELTSYLKILVSSIVAGQVFFIKESQITKKVKSKSHRNNPNANSSKFQQIPQLYTINYMNWTDEILFVTYYWLHIKKNKLLSLFSSKTSSISSTGCLMITSQLHKSFDAWKPQWTLVDQKPS